MRLFIALPLPPDIEACLGTIIDDLRRRDDGVKWVEPDVIHLTVRFLGETTPDLVPQISAGMDAAVKDIDPMACELERLGGFPNLNRPRVIWVGLKESSQHLVTIASRMEALARQLGFEPENKSFKAHLTLGRVKDDRKLEDFPRRAQAYQLQPKPFLLDRLVLFQSTLTPRGSIYKRLHESLLG